MRTTVVLRLQLAETRLCLVKEREEVSMTDTTVRGAGKAASANHAGGEGQSRQEQENEGKA